MSNSLCVVGHLMLPLLTASQAPVVGGAEVQMFHLGAELQRRGWQLSFLVCGLDGRERGTIATDYGPAEILYARRTRKTRAQQVQEKWRLWAAVSATDADFVFQRAVWDADVAALAARRRRRPFVYALASDRDAVALPRWSRRRAVIGLASAIVAQTASQHDWMRRYGRESVCIPSGFPVPPWSATGRDTILWAGTLRALKRPHVFLDLAAALPGAPFVLCGGRGEDAALAAAIAERAAGLANVRNDGFVPYADMESRFARARIFINTSTYEGFPNTFIQAWLHGALVLSLGVDPDGCLSRQGLGAVAADPAELLALVRRALHDHAWVEATIVRARAHAERHHDIGRVASAYEAVFRSTSARG